MIFRNLNRNLVAGGNKSVRFDMKRRKALPSCSLLKYALFLKYIAKQRGNNRQTGHNLETMRL